jgi:DNA mismatch endonuclease, patch repair protein
MADTVTKEQRSYIMSRVRSKDTKPEMLVRRFLFANGFRYRIHRKDLPGSPDIVLPKYRTVVFVQGCFWHHHNPGCRSGKFPKTNIDYWSKKIEHNVHRDIRNQIELSRLGWKPIIVWECELQKKKTRDTLESLVKEIVVPNI